MFDGSLSAYWEPSDTAESRTLIDDIGASGRAEARAAAARLVAIGKLFAIRMAERGETPEWAVDTWAAVGAEIAAALRISLAMAGSYMHYALALRNRLPAVATAFCAGDIDFWTFRTIVYRTDLITDAAALEQVDAALAVRAARWPPMTQGRLANAIDRIVAGVDRDALRRVRENVKDREVSIWDDESGLAGLNARLFATDAHSLDQRLDALAATVCDADPRTPAQRRADALGALAAGADRLACRCGRQDCAAGGMVSARNVVIHVVAEQSSTDGTGTAPGYLVREGVTIGAEVVGEVAATAKQQPVIHPLDAPPESGVVPSKALADFVRCRDLTCRAPGCDKPAVECDIDHTIPRAEGGRTHATNLKCMCRTHHLLKTFWGWRDEQLPDGTVIWKLPSGQTYITIPGSALLFPALMVPTGGLPAPDAPTDRRGDKTATMPVRNRTRRQNRARYIAAERAHNRGRRLARQSPLDEALAVGAALEDDQPPPF